MRLPGELGGGDCEDDVDGAGAGGAAETGAGAAAAEEGAPTAGAADIVGAIDAVDVALAEGNTLSLLAAFFRAGTARAGRTFCGAVAVSIGGGAVVAEGEGGGGVVAVDGAAARSAGALSIGATDTDLARPPRITAITETIVAAAAATSHRPRLGRSLPSGCDVMSPKAE